MTTVKATCDDCGLVEMAHTEIVLSVCDVPWYSYYSFACPRCHCDVRKDVDDRVTCLLMSAGVLPVEWHLPLEVIEWPTADIPLITVDDVRNFTLDLHVADIYAELD